MAAATASLFSTRGRRVSICLDERRAYLYAEHGRGREWLTGVNISHNYLGSLIRKETRSLGANALSTASDDGDLSSKHTLGVVEVVGDLCHAVRHDGR